MVLSIKNDEADKLARGLAALTGRSMTEAVVVALRRDLDRERVLRGGDMVARMERFAAEHKKHRVVDHRSADEIIGYDEHGAPA